MGSFVFVGIGGWGPGRESFRVGPRRKTGELSVMGVSAASCFDQDLRSVAAPAVMAVMCECVHVLAT